MIREGILDKKHLACSGTHTTGHKMMTFFQRSRKCPNLWIHLRLLRAHSQEKQLVDGDVSLKVCVEQHDRTEL